VLVLNLSQFTFKTADCLFLFINFLYILLFEFFITVSQLRVLIGQSPNLSFQSLVAALQRVHFTDEFFFGECYSLGQQLFIAASMFLLLFKHLTFILFGFLLIDDDLALQLDGLLLLRGQHI
jgi:hypothetical protein